MSVTTEDLAKQLVTACNARRNNKEVLTQFLKVFLQNFDSTMSGLTDENWTQLADAYLTKTIEVQKILFFRTFLDKFAEKPVRSTENDLAALGVGEAGSGAVGEPLGSVGPMTEPQQLPSVATVSTTPQYIWMPEYYAELEGKKLPADKTTESEKQVWYISNIQSLQKEAKKFKDFLISLADIYTKLPASKQDRFDDDPLIQQLGVAIGVNTAIQKYSLPNISEADYNKFRTSILDSINPSKSDSTFHKIAAIVLAKYRDLTENEIQAIKSDSEVSVNPELIAFLDRWMQVKDILEREEQPFNGIRQIITINYILKLNLANSRKLVTFMRDSIITLYKIMKATNAERRIFANRISGDEISRVEAEQNIYTHSLIGGLTDKPGGGKMINSSSSYYNSSKYKQLNDIITALADNVVFAQVNPTAYINIKKEEAFRLFNSELKDIGKYFLNTMPAEYYNKMRRTPFKVIQQEIDDIRTQIGNRVGDPAATLFFIYLIDKGTGKNYDDSLDTSKPGVPTKPNYYELSVDETTIRELMPVDAAGGGGGGVGAPVAASGSAAGAGGGGVATAAAATALTALDIQQLAAEAAMLRQQLRPGNKLNAEQKAQKKARQTEINLIITSFGQSSSASPAPDTKRGFLGRVGNFFRGRGGGTRRRFVAHSANQDSRKGLRKRRITNRNGR